jgi:hypothetical protein
MGFAPADGDTARWRRVDEYIDTKKLPSDLISFREIQDFLDVNKPTAVGVIQQLRVQREKAGKRTLVTMRGAGWLLARPDQELEEDTRRHGQLLNTAEGRVRLLGSIQGRRSELTDEERRTLDFKRAPGHCPGHRPGQWQSISLRHPEHSRQPARADHRPEQPRNREKLMMPT